MEVTLTQSDLIALVSGTSPYYSIFDNPIVKRCGSFTGGFVDKWSWDTSELKKLSETQLYDLYQLCKSSWK